MFKTGSWLAYLLPAIYGAISFYQYYQDVFFKPIHVRWVIYIPYTGIGLQQMLSTILLGYGMSKIRSLIVQNDSTELNNKKILLHLVCCIAYMLTLFFIFLRMIAN